MIPIDLLFRLKASIRILPLGREGPRRGLLIWLLSQKMPLVISLPKLGSEALDIRKLGISLLVDMGRKELVV